MILVRTNHPYLRVERHRFFLQKICPNCLDLTILCHLHQAYDINGYTYYTKEKDKKSVAQNSGIRIEAIDPQGLKTTYYGYIQDI